MGRVQWVESGELALVGGVDGLSPMIPFSHGRRKAGRTRVELGLKRVSTFT